MHPVPGSALLEAMCKNLPTREISLEALGLLQALRYRDYPEAQLRANRMARRALQHDYLKVADAAEKIEALLTDGRPNAMELRIALRGLTKSVGTIARECGASAR